MVFIGYIMIFIVFFWFSWFLLKVFSFFFFLNRLYSRTPKVGMLFWERFLGKSQQKAWHRGCWDLERHVSRHLYSFRFCRTLRLFAPPKKKHEKMSQRSEKSQKQRPGDPLKQQPAAAPQLARQSGWKFLAKASPSL